MSFILREPSSWKTPLVLSETTDDDDEDEDDDDDYNGTNTFTSDEIPKLVRAVINGHAGQSL